MKKLILTVVCLVVAGAAVFFGRPVYRNWKHERFQKQALTFLANGDLRNASLSARQALAIKPNDAASTRIMAQVTESLHSPLAILWRQRVVDIEPGVVQNRLELTRTALFLGEFTLAEQALSAVSLTNRDSVTFHQLAAMIAVAENNLPQADWHFAEASRLDPQNKLVQLNQAIIHLQAKNKSLVQAAVKTLESLSADPAFRQDALRHLIMTAVRNKDFANAEEFSRQLQTGERTTFEDRVLYLSVLYQADSHEFTNHLEALKTECINNPLNIPTLAAWLSSHQKADVAIQWLVNLPEKIQAEQAFRVALADAYSERGDWVKLENFLQNQNWGEYEFIRLAHLAHATRQQKQDIITQDNWQAAVRSATDRVKALSVLAQLATAWKMDAEREDLLWTIVQRYPAERWALQTLNSIYTAGGNSEGLQRVYATQISYDPDDSIAKNNYATISLLLNVQLNRAHEMAQADYEKNPKNAAFATTYAYSLHLHERTAEGLKILNTLPEQQLKAPSIAVYYGVLLAASGDHAKAKKYLDLAAADSSLLPEEKALIQTAR